MMALSYVASVSLSAFLLFLVQPILARMLLPVYGGTPAVWNTCLVFFQVLLLAGYAYAHVTTHWLGVRRQAIVHLVLLAVPFITLPIALPASAVPDETAIQRPVLWLVGTLGRTVG